MFPKKGSRKITVDSIEYEWHVNNRGEYLIILIKAKENQGSLIEVISDSEIHRVWQEYPMVSNMKLSPIKPKMVSEMIGKAIKLGWKPLENGKIKRFKYKIDEKENISFSELIKSEIEKENFFYKLRVKKMNV